MNWRFISNIILKYMLNILGFNIVYGVKTEVFDFGWLDGWAM